jgi:hypothetical protein
MILTDYIILMGRKPIAIKKIDNEKNRKVLIIHIRLLISTEKKALLKRQWNSPFYATPK